jgi:starch phosphorylase
MAYLAMRGCATAHGVSRLHGVVSRRLFTALYPRWPEHEVPIGYITNGVHAPSWDSPWADRLWTHACGKARWCGTVEPLTDAIQALSDEMLWACRAEERQDLIRYARTRLARQLGQRGALPETVAQASQVLDPHALTLGFARRFTGYKRPTLLLHDTERLRRVLANPTHPVQIIVAGKAHPADEEGKRLVQAWADFISRGGAWVCLHRACSGDTPRGALYPAPSPRPPGSTDPTGSTPHPLAALASEARWTYRGG